jgi:hypothetical protein
MGQTSRVRSFRPDTTNYAKWVFQVGSPDPIRPIMLNEFHWSSRLTRENYRVMPGLPTR